MPPFQPKQLVPKLLPYVATRAGTLLKLFEEQAETGNAIELDDLFMDMTMDVINYYLYGRSDLNYDLVGGRRNLKVILVVYTIITSKCINSKIHRMNIIDLV